LLGLKTALISSWTYPTFQSQSPIRRLSRERPSGWERAQKSVRQLKWHSGSKAAGCIAAAIPTSFTKQELARPGADFVVDNFEELRALIETREGG
jgi:hypothetical protein